METLPVNLDNETLKQIDFLSEKQNLSPSRQFHEAIKKIKPQLDKDWLDSLVTEDDILDAAVKLTQAVG